MGGSQMRTEPPTLSPGAFDPGVHARRRARRAGARSSRRELTRIFLVLLALTFALRLPGVLHAGVQLRRDVPRHPGARAQRGRPALPGCDRPQAADRALRVRGHVLLLRDHRAVVGAHRRHARGRTHRVVARHRSSETLRRARGMDRGSDVRRRHGVVRATRRTGGELRGVHAADDDGRRPLRAARTGFPRRGRDRRWPPWPSRPARPRCSRSSTSSRAPGGRRASARSRSGSRSRPRWSRWRWVPRSSCTGRCWATARTSA